MMGRVYDIDVGAHHLTLADGRRLGYDTLVVAAGAVSSDFGIEGVEEYTFPLKSLDDAVALRTHLIANFERAASTPGTLPEGALDVVICGGGPTGVEMAGGVSELYRKVLAHDFPELPVEHAGITLIEMADRVLTPFSEASSRAAASTLRSMGVELRLGVGIERVRADEIDLSDGTTLRARTCVWAAGVRAHPIATALGVELARSGRIPVADDLSVVGCDDVFAIGDIAAVPDDEGSPLPQVAQPAIQGGRHVAEQIERRLRDEPPLPFRYVDKGSMATIGRHSAVAELANGWRLSGFAGWISWLGLHLVYLMGFRNRLNVFVNWCWNYLTFDRASRLLGEHDLDQRDDT
jgi:NADH dehydrogenase